MRGVGGQHGNDAKELRAKTDWRRNSGWYHARRLGPNLGRRGTVRLAGAAAGCGWACFNFGGRDGSHVGAVGGEMTDRKGRPDG